MTNCLDKLTDSSDSNGNNFMWQVHCN